MSASTALSLQERAYELARQDFEHTIEHLDSEEACSMTHSELERMLEKKGRELCACLVVARAAPKTGLARCCWGFTACVQPFWLWRLA